MSIRIYGSNYLNGMPVLDYKIEINGVTIGVNKKDFTMLLGALSKELREDYQKALAVKRKHDNNIEKLRELRRDIIDIFWSGDQDEMDTIFFRREVSEIDQEKLWDTLEKYNKLLGFE